MSMRPLEQRGLFLIRGDVNDFDVEPLLVEEALRLRDVDRCPPRPGILTDSHLRLGLGSDPQPGATIRATSKPTPIEYIFMGTPFFDQGSRGSSTDIGDRRLDAIRQNGRARSFSWSVARPHALAAFLGSSHGRAFRPLGWRRGIVIRMGTSRPMQRRVITAAIALAVSSYGCRLIRHRRRGRGCTHDGRWA